LKLISTLTAISTFLKSTPALYTDEARTHGIEGTVTIVAEVGSDGEIKYTRVLKGLGFGLDEAATASVREWALSPATKWHTSRSGCSDRSTIRNCIAIANANVLRTKQWHSTIVPSSAKTKVRMRMSLAKSEHRRANVSNRSWTKKIIATHPTKVLDSWIQFFNRKYLTMRSICAQSPNA
jgi:TonB family protein